MSAFFPSLPCSSPALVRDISWLNGFSLQHIALSNKKKEAWQTGGIYCGGYIMPCKTHKFKAAETLLLEAPCDLHPFQREHFWKSPIWWPARGNSSQAFYPFCGLKFFAASSGAAVQSSEAGRKKLDPSIRNTSCACRLSVPLDYMQAKRQSLSRASRRQKTTNTKRGMSRREKESRDGNKGRLCSHDFSFVSPRGDVLPNTKSEAVRITRMETQSRMQRECTQTHLFTFSF